MSESWKSKNYKQFCIVRDLLSSGNWYSLRDIEHGIKFQYAQSSISARLREFKKFGLEVQKRKVKYIDGKGVWQYRLVKKMRLSA